MAVTEVERTELVNRLMDAIGKEAAETLMSCVLPDGRDQLATKSDLEVLEARTSAGFAELRGEMEAGFAQIRGEMEANSAELRAYVDRSLAKQTRLYMGTMVFFMLSIWSTIFVQGFG